LLKCRRDRGFVHVRAEAVLNCVPWNGQTAVLKTLEVTHTLIGRDSIERYGLCAWVIGTPPAMKDNNVAASLTLRAIGPTEPRSFVIMILSRETRPAVVFIRTRLLRKAGHVMLPTV
jgi:hypothetical protein